MLRLDWTDKSIGVSYDLLDFYIFFQNFLFWPYNRLTETLQTQYPYITPTHSLEYQHLVQPAQWSDQEINLDIIQYYLTKLKKILKSLYFFH